jgi:hypothetical protein
MLLPAAVSRPHRRLGRLQTHLTAPAAAAAGVVLGSAFDVVQQQLLPIPLLQRPIDLSPGAAASGGAWMQPDCAAVREAMASAVASADFRLAALLQDLAFTADPKPQLSADDCAPGDPQASADFFTTNGFVSVHTV